MTTIRTFLVWCAIVHCTYAVVIEKTAGVSGRITSPSPTILVYEGMKNTNPELPVVYAPLKVDTSSWSTNGDEVTPIDPISLSGFDLPSSQIEMLLDDCQRHQYQHGPITSSITSCKVKGFTYVDNPTLFLQPIQLDMSHVVFTEQGTKVDTSGIATIEGPASGSFSTAKVSIVSEPAVTLPTIAGAFGLLVLGLRRVLNS